MTVKQLLCNIRSENVICAAGLGRYSSIEASRHFGKKPLVKLIKHLKTCSSEISFSIRPDSQLLPYADFENHRLPFFVHNAKSSIPVISNLFKSKGYETLHNPHTDELKKFFTISDDSVIIRPSIRKKPLYEEFATVKKISVDGYSEKDKILIMNHAGYEKFFRNIVLSIKINMAGLLRYACRLRVRAELKNKLISRDKDIMVY